MMEDKIKGFYFYIPENHLSWDRYDDWVEDLKFCVLEMTRQYEDERRREEREKNEH